ncbi:MAG: hypothetical protein WCF13_06690 [Stellaceae bacterium]
MPFENQPMIGSCPRLRFAIRASVAALAIAVLACCTDMHGSANANGNDRSSVGQVRLGWPF